MKRLVFLVLVIVATIVALPYFQQWQEEQRADRNAQQARSERLTILTVQSEVMATLNSAAQSACQRLGEGIDGQSESCEETGAESQ